MAAQTEFAGGLGSFPSFIKLETKEQILQKGTLTSVDLANQVQKVNSVVGWSDYNKAISRYFSSKETLCLCATNEGNPEKQSSIEGYLIIKLNFPHRGSAEIPYIVTAQKTAGVGTALLRAAVEKTKEHGCDHLEWDCRPKVMEFYTKFAERQGLHLVLTDNGCYMNGDRKTHMSMQIGAGSSA